MTLATQWNSLGLFLYENRDILFSQIYNQICSNFETSCTDNLYMMTAKGATYYIQVAKQKGRVTSLNWNLCITWGYHAFCTHLSWIKTQWVEKGFESPIWTFWTFWDWNTNHIKFESVFSRIFYRYRLNGDNFE